MTNLPSNLFSNPLLNLVVVSLLLVSEQSNAHQPAAGKATGMVGPAIYKTVVSENSNIESPLFGGFGFVAEGDVDYNGGIEVGLYFMQQAYYRQEDDKVLAEKVTRLHIALGYRHWFNPSFSAGLSFFSSYSMGDYSVIQKDKLPSGETATSGQDTTEYGLDASLQWEFWRDETNAVLIDTRYSHSVTKKPGEYGDHVGLFLGYKRSVEFN